VPPALGNGARYSSDLTIGVGEDEFRLKASTSLAADGSLYCDIYGPFGSQIAAIEGSLDAGEIIVGARSYRFERGQRIGEIDGLGDIPFTFGQLARILTGYGAESAVPGRQPDTVTAEGRSALLSWRSDSAGIDVALKGSRCRPESLSVRAGDGSWYVSCSDFAAGTPLQVRFGEPEGNYFVLRHRKVTRGD
jgi:hypothetical protein